MNDLSNAVACGAPASVCEIRDIVATDLQKNHADNNCQLAGVTASPIATLDWTFTSSGCILEINRGFLVSATLQDPLPSSSSYTIEATQVTLTYPYQWQFGRVIGLLVTGANFSASAFSSQATMENLN